MRGVRKLHDEGWICIACRKGRRENSSLLCYRRRSTLPFLTCLPYELRAAACLWPRAHLFELRLARRPSLFRRARADGERRRALMHTACATHRGALPCSQASKQSSERRLPLACGFVHQPFRRLLTPLRTDVPPEPTGAASQSASRLGMRPSTSAPAVAAAAAELRSPANRLGAPLLAIEAKLTQSCNIWFCSKAGQPLT